MSRTLVLVRHGESIWNREGKFTGWSDIDLSPKGHDQAHRAGRVLKEQGFSFDCAFTSVLTRAIRTLWIILDEMGLMWVPVENSWRLNERHYGALQGLDKAAVVANYGDEQVKIWRRSYDVRPPFLEEGDSRSSVSDPRYGNVAKADIPAGESLRDTVSRMLPYWHEMVAPRLREGKRVIVAAHGNSLRGLVKHLDAVADSAIVRLSIPTGIPLVYELNDALEPQRHYYLATPDEVAQAVAAAETVRSGQP